MELLDVLEEDGSLTGRKEDKDIIHEKGLWHREVAVLIRNEKGEYLIQKREATKKQAPNKWGMTAGHVDAGENFQEAMVREIKEELGIEVPVEELRALATFKQPYESKTTTNNNYTRYYFYETNRKIEEYIICLEELSELKYISLEEMQEAVENKDQRCSYAQRDEMKEVIALLKNINQ